MSHVNVKPQDKITAAQVKAIRGETGLGLVAAKKLAKLLNDKGYITWTDVHTI